MRVSLKFRFVFTCAASNQGDGFGAGGANNQAAQAIDQSGLFGGGINQGQAGKRDVVIQQST
jgi:hypothetical protein